MNERWNKDGLTRKRLEEDLRIHEPFRVVESDLSNLLARALSRSSALYQNHPLVILNEIGQVDTDYIERDFIKWKSQDSQGGNARIAVLHRSLRTQFASWCQRLDRGVFYTSRGGFYLDMERYNQLYEKKVSKEALPDQRGIYMLLRFIRNLQKKQESYFLELTQSRNTDPSLAVLIAFLKNYRELAMRFNKRWEEFPLYYIRQILNVSPQKEVLPYAWFVALKNSTDQTVLLPKGTGIMSMVPYRSRSIPFGYRTEEDYWVNDMSLRKVVSLMLEKDKTKYPAGRLGFVTAIWKNELDARIGHVSEKTPCTDSTLIFEDHQSVQAGLMIESPMLLLREGQREVYLTFELEDASVAYFQSLLLDDEQSPYEVERILNDAFLLEISTEKGWERIPTYTLTFTKNKAFFLKFVLHEKFSSTSPCSDQHGFDSKKPILRVLMNPDAWLFPYSWMRHIEIRSLRIKVCVTGLFSVKVHNPLGELDASVYIPLLGITPQKGSWFAFGNYEMAIKPVVHLDLSLRWMGLPYTEGGFYDLYQGYHYALDNTSFKIQWEKLEDRNWVRLPDGESNLFFTSPGHTSPRGKLSDQSLLVYDKSVKNQLFKKKEEQFMYPAVRQGFYRIVLDSPDVGFAYPEYQQLFSEIMMRNSRQRTPLPIPQSPYTPMIEDVRVSYHAEEVYNFNGNEVRDRCHIYHLSPFLGKKPNKVDVNHPFRMMDVPDNDGTILFGIRDAIGNDRIRLFFEMAPLKKEILKDELPQVEWCYFNGRRWETIHPDSIIADTTGGLMHTGLIEILLPLPIGNEWLDENGDFGLSAKVLCNAVNCSAIRNIFLNPVKAVLEVQEGQADLLDEALEDFTGIVSFMKSQSGFTDIFQITPAKGGHSPETPQNMRLRIAQEVSHRNRAVLPADYEQMVLAKFPEVEKVLCLPGVDSKSPKRKGIVTLVIMQKESNKKILPLCEYRLLLAIEDYLEHMTSPFVIIDAITPVYETVTVYCNLQIKPGCSSGSILRRAEARINTCIAPWTEKNEPPVFGHSLTLTDLHNSIREDEEVVHVESLSVAHIVYTLQGQRKSYRLNRYPEGTEEDAHVRPSFPWCILAPCDKHIIYIDQKDALIEQLGVGDLGIEGNFIINQ